MKSTFSLALTLAVALAAPCAHAAVDCLTVAASSAQQHAGAFAGRFQATQVLDVDLSVLFSARAAGRLAGDHVVEVRVYTPKGNLYQSIELPFTADSGRRNQERRLPGHPEPLALRGLAAATLNRSLFFAVKATLPVAGTPILNNSLYGQWTAEAFVDGASAACGPKGTFTISE